MYVFTLATVCPDILSPGCLEATRAYGVILIHANKQLPLF